MVGCWSECDEQESCDRLISGLESPPYLNDFFVAELLKIYLSPSIWHFGVLSAANDMTTYGNEFMTL